jgi:hypothetical protein
MQNEPQSALGLRKLLLPKNNLWSRRVTLVFTFVLFDYLSTLAFCHAPQEEANMLARAFMESLGIIPGLTLFVLTSNLPIYVTLSFDSHMVRLPSKIAPLLEVPVDALFAWFVAGVHFNGGSSWFWSAPDLLRQAFGAILYIIMVFLVVKPHRPHYGN